MEKHVSCVYYNRNASCFYGNSRNNEGVHKGTETKINLMAKYVNAWCRKIAQFKQNGVLKYKRIVFVDCMAGAGELRQKKSECNIKGTCSRVASILNDAAKTYSESYFQLIANDIDEQSYNCLSCRLLPIKTNDNVDITTKKGDAKDLLLELIQNIEDGKYNCSHFLIYYDPYSAEVRWKEILELCALIKKVGYERKIGFDLVINHMLQNDTIRFAKLNPSRYTLTYGVEDRELLGVLDIEDPSAKREQLRLLFLKNLKEEFKLSDNKNLAYFPIIGDKTQVFDLVFFSFSITAKRLFKSSMLKAAHEIYGTENIEGKFKQIDLLAGVAFEEENPTDKKQKVEYYGYSSHAEHIFKEFRGKGWIGEDEILEYVDTHLYVTFSSIREIKDALSLEYGVKKNKKQYYFGGVNE